MQNIEINEGNNSGRLNRSALMKDSEYVVLKELVVKKEVVEGAEG